MEHPILFSSEMVQAILAGRKTQTRRPVKFSHPFPPADTGLVVAYPAAETGWIFWGPKDFPDLAEFTKRQYKHGIKCPYGEAGDYLWVRETWYDNYADRAYDHSTARLDPYGASLIWYRADSWHDGQEGPEQISWRPSIHMPRWASRLTLEITSIRPERLQLITLDDIEREGTPENPMGQMSYRNDAYQHIRDFAWLWDGLYAGCGYGWNQNPWVWVISFRDTTRTPRRGDRPA